MSDKKRLTVLLDARLAEDFEDFCRENSPKKGSLAERLIKEFLKNSGYPEQAKLL